MDQMVDALLEVWNNGFTISELWGRTEPVARGGPLTSNTHLIMWGILSIVDDQVRRGAGHDYLRDRLWHGDWIALGYRDERLAVVPPISDAKFGRKPSAIGDGVVKFTQVRIVHADVFHALRA